MALIACTQCTQIISNKARACPNCQCKRLHVNDDEIKQNILLTLIPTVTLIVLICLWNLIVNIIVALIIAAIVIAAIIAFLYILAGMAS